MPPIVSNPTAVATVTVPSAAVFIITYFIPFISKSFVSGSVIVLGAVSTTITDGESFVNTVLELTASTPGSIDFDANKCLVTDLVTKLISTRSAAVTSFVAVV